VDVICLHDRDEIERVLRRDVFLHIYEIGDLDDFFWPYTTWYALADREDTHGLVLLYSGMPLPVVLGLARDAGPSMRRLLGSVRHLLPRRVYAHLSPDLITELAQDFAVEPFGEYQKMALTDLSRLDSVDAARVRALSVADLPDLRSLYDTSYPGNAFDPRMLQTGQYYGIRHEGCLVSVAGIHVYSERYRVAALGNVTTHPQYRGRGLSTAVCGRLCRALLQKVDHIGLNVKLDNASAIACYERLGFSAVAPYSEYSLELKVERG
jgi:ribosomal protein S18 acetylase RimI-like enzyme